VPAERGFNVITWRKGDLGYALVSDVDAPVGRILWPPSCISGDRRV
jgi:hypothetical protein